MSAFDNWIGRQWSRSETISARQLAHFRLTLAGLVTCDAAPPGFHWCLTPDAGSPGDLGADGHPRTGLILPDLGLPRRMWAGGEISRLDGLQPGESVERVTTLADITFRNGKSGQLGFLTLNHDYQVEGRTRILERQDIVYREAPKPGSAGQLQAAEPWVCDAVRRLTPDAVLLFRYSALTFNGHRIHYDHPYATLVEGYSGLVVHGPLQATLMLNLAADILGRAPQRFHYRGLSPLICGEEIRIEAKGETDGLALRVVREADGVATMEATAVA